MADLQLRILGEDAASSAFSSVAGAARAAQQIIIDFTKQSIKAYMESESVQRQLQLVAKGLTGAFQEQASAMAQANNISDELVQQMQTMLLRYGEAPAAVGATTQAVLDYAAATGTDARTATEALTRGVETGTGHFKGLGISIDATGSKTKDLAVATAALAKKYGGAGAADAESLTGQVRGLQEAFGDLQESFGGFIVDVGNKTGVLKTLTDELRNVTKGMDIVKRFVEAGGASALYSSAKAILFGGTAEEITASRVAFNRAAATAVQPVITSGGGAGPEGRKSGGGGDKVSGGGGGGGASRGLEGDMYGPQTYDAWKYSTPAEGPAAPTPSEQQSMARAAADAAKRQAETHAKALEDMLRATRDTAAKLAAESKRFADAGSAMANALSSNLVSGLEQLMGGGEQDIGQIIANVLASLLTAAGGILGNLLLPGIGGALGGAIGGLAGAGVKALANGPQQNVTINTMDSRSTREFFESDGGRGFYNAQRTGLGQGGR
jgi:hypothetical protein